MSIYTDIKKRRRKKLIRNLIIVIISIVIICAGYVAYMIYSYERLPDRMYMDVEITGSYSQLESRTELDTSKFYQIMTYNIGFGAYTSDYSFFADGGRSSWAKSEEAVMANICEISNVINYTAPDFILLQEVDINGTRSYHVDERLFLNSFLPSYYYDFAINYDSKFIMYPIYQPHGKNVSGMATYSVSEISEALRQQLPVSDNKLDRLFDLDRCYSRSKIRLDNGKSFCLYNVHLSAYGSDPSVREAQLKLVFNDMANEYKAGNYIICGGDFNHDLKRTGEDNEYSWAAPFPVENLPKGFYLPLDLYMDTPGLKHDSCRNANEPYDEETTFTVTTDGFIVSDNIAVNFYTNADWGYAFSDHDPVVMQFKFKPL